MGKGIIPQSFSIQEFLHHSGVEFLCHFYLSSFNGRLNRVTVGHQHAPPPQTICMAPSPFHAFIGVAVVRKDGFWRQGRPAWHAPRPSTPASGFPRRCPVPIFLRKDSWLLRHALMDAMRRSPSSFPPAARTSPSIGRRECAGTMDADLALSFAST
jgi:hypothetical protein